MTSLETFSKLRPPECVRIKIKKKNANGSNEIKKLCVDPLITSFEILQNLIAEAFSTKNDLILNYLNRETSKYDNEIYTTLWNDWDLDAAFMNSSQPFLCITVEFKPDCSNNYEDDWDVINAVDLPKNDNSRNTDGSRSVFATWSNNAAGKAATIFQKMFNGLSRSNSLNKVSSNSAYLNEDHPYYNLYNSGDQIKWKQPLGESEFKHYLDSDGRIIQHAELKQRIFEGGIDFKLRRVIWRYLLNIYPIGLTGMQRVDYMKSLSQQYYRLKSMWHNKPHMLNDDDIKPIAHRIQKDVLRTDRTIRFYTGDANIKSLFNILLTYSLTHSSISYSQGMSDLLSPILFILRNEAHAYICFCSLMKRLKTNFSIHSDTIELKIKLLQLLLKEYDPQFWEYLENVGASHILYVYRWLLLESKREFSFTESLRVFEIMWSTLNTIEVDDIEQLCLFEDDTSIFAKNRLLEKIPVATTKSLPATISYKETSPIIITKPQQNYQEDVVKSKENNLKRLKSKKSLECEDSECKKKFVKSHSEYDDSDDSSLNNYQDNDYHDNDYHFETGDDESNEAQKTLVPETASKLLSNLAHAYSDSHIDSIANEKSFMGRNDKQNTNFNLIAQSKHELLAKDCESNTKRLNICYLFERSTSASKLSVTPTNKTHIELEQDVSEKPRESRKKSSCSSTMASSTSCSCSNSLYNSYNESYDQQSTTETSSISSKRLVSVNCCSSDARLVSHVDATIAEEVIKNPSLSSTTNTTTNTTTTNNTNDHKKHIDSGYCSDVTNSPLIQTDDDLIYSLSKIDNPFLLFLCLTLFIENRDYIMNSKLDSDDIACYFDKMIRKHNSKNVLSHARYLYSKLYLSKVNVFNYIQQIMQK